MSLFKWTLNAKPPHTMHLSVIKSIQHDMISADLKEMFYFHYKTLPISIYKKAPQITLLFVDQMNEILVLFFITKRYE